MLVCMCRELNSRVLAYVDGTFHTINVLHPADCGLEVEEQRMLFITYHPHSSPQVEVEVCHGNGRDFYFACRSAEAFRLTSPALCVAGLEDKG